MTPFKAMFGSTKGCMGLEDSNLPMEQLKAIGTEEELEELYRSSQVNSIRSSEDESNASLEDLSIPVEMFNDDPMEV
jgi:hypothetical protein